MFGYIGIRYNYLYLNILILIYTLYTNVPFVFKIMKLIKIITTDVYYWLLQLGSLKA